MIKTVIIDDDRMTIDGLTRTVDWNKLGLTVVATAKNGAEGLEQIRLHDPELIITDIFMPIMDGIEMLKTLRSEGNTAEVMILSGYEDFKYAQSALKLQVNDYISKPATLEEIELALKSMADQISRKAVNSQEEHELRELLAFNRPTTSKQLIKGLLEPGFCQSAFFDKVTNYLNMDFSKKQFVAVVIEFFINRERNAWKASDVSLFAYAVQNIVNELSHSKQDVYVVDTGHKLMTIIVSLPSHAKKEALQRKAKQIAEEVLDSIQSYLKLEVFAAIGSAAAHVEEIPRSYAQALDLLAEREHRPDRQLILQEEAQEMTKVAVRRPMECFQALVDAVMLGQEELVEDKIAELVHILHNGPNPSINALRKFAIDIAGMLALMLHDQHLQLEDIHNDLNLYKELEHLSSIQTFASWLRDLMLPICEVMERRSSQKHRKTIEFIMRYVQEHYADDITLDVLAEKVYLTRNYLSQIFKQETGENYNGYLTRIRMEKAKELMLSGNYKIFEISHRVGYKNNAYFSQLFKKYTGMNPSDFNQ